MVKRPLFYLKTLMINNRVSPDLTALLYKCIWLIEHCPTCVVEIDYYYIKIKTSSSSIELWNANKFFAWISRGSVNGNSFGNIMPSRAAMYDFKECLKKRGYNIYQKKDEEKINLSRIKC